MITKIILLAVILYCNSAVVVATGVHLRGIDNEHITSITTDSTTNKRKKTNRQGGEFSNECLRGRFSYYNTAADVASLTVGVFDGNGNISEFDDLYINHPDGEGGRIDATLPFNSGTYEVSSNGRGQMYISMGEEGGAYYDPPAKFEFVITGTDDDCEVINMDSFLVADVGLASQMVAPHWTKIAES